MRNNRGIFEWHSNNIEISGFVSPLNIMKSLPIFSASKLLYPEELLLTKVKKMRKLNFLNHTFLCKLIW